MKKKSIDDIKKFNIREAIELVKNDAMTNVILLSHMPNITMEDKMYLCYFMGMKKGEPYILDFADGVAEFTININKVKINKEK